ncbi:hypothetical protein HMI54_002763 [Coelomomyces lativittatus]|nr:hypothetical protein HMI56_007540 [Coelomomyces lativittatus]KAJ1508966.1 hypothetical protein HMI54_002763 [Coelomomyces lativittatus]KAJ1516461.1 hypothetical protein HMI55_002202 [Coelomomyces lativittatus]
MSFLTDPIITGDYGSNFLTHSMEQIPYDIYFNHLFFLVFLYLLGIKALHVIFPSKLIQTSYLTSKYVFAGYLLIHTLFFGMEIYFKAATKFTPSVVVHHLLAISLFGTTLYDLDSIWKNLAWFHLLPFIIHAYSWLLEGTKTLFLYNLGLLLSGLHGMDAPTLSSLSFLVFSLMLTNVYTYCQDLEGDYCIQLVQDENKFTSSDNGWINVWWAFTLLCVLTRWTGLQKN